MNDEPLTVLVLDDDEAVRDSIADFLEDRGWRVLRAATAEDALDMLGEESLDGAVVDIRLPGMDGNAFIRAACATSPGLAYVICTGSPEYRPPDEVTSLPQVSPRTFTKPLHNLAALEAELRRHIEVCGRKGSNDD